MLTRIELNRLVFTLEQVVDHLYGEQMDAVLSGSRLSDDLIFYKQMLMQARLALSNDDYNTDSLCSYYWKNVAEFYVEAA